VLSATVERSHIEAKPLVRVYSSRGLTRLLLSAGFTDVKISVRHLIPEDTAPARLVARRPRLLGWAERHFGWYVIAHARVQRAA
jgi:hypothetical protein